MTRKITNLKEIASHELCKLAKFAGIPQSNFQPYYDDEGIIYSRKNPDCSVYTLTEIQTWIRTKYGVRVWIKPIDICWEYWIEFKQSKESYLTFEEALEAGLEEALRTKIVI